MKFIYENCFDIFLSASWMRRESIFILSKLIYLDLGTIISKQQLKNKIPDLAGINSWLVAKVSECTQHVVRNWNCDMECKDEANYMDLTLFTDFISDLKRYFAYELKDRSCCKLCLILVNDLLSVKKSTCYAYARDILNKDNFYLLNDENNHVEVISILCALLSAATDISQNREDFDLEKTEDKATSVNLTECIEKFVERVTPFQDAIRVVQPYLVEKLIFLPIECNYCSLFFWIVASFEKILSFDHFPNDETSLLKLKSTFSLAVTSPSIFDTLVPEEVYVDRTRVSFYRNFFNEISAVIYTRVDIYSTLMDEFIILVNECEKKPFLDDFEENKTTVYYDIFRTLTRNVAKREDEKGSLDNLFDETKLK
jgi:hypothetical protein